MLVHDGARPLITPETIEKVRALPGVRVVALCDADTAVLEKAVASVKSQGKAK